MKLSHESFAFFWWEFDRTLGWLIINEATMAVLVGNPLYAHLVSYGRSSSCFLRWKIDTNVYSAMTTAKLLYLTTFKQTSVKSDLELSFNNFSGTSFVSVSAVTSPSSV
uniref:Uncharacterized protein n=1 Tax=Brassica oleracea var. oleracea TaxID=109376 RepID=A0A0D3AG37_BRAOL